MYIKSYKKCGHCDKEIVSSRHKVHESKCPKQQADKLNKPGKAGRPIGMPAWNKGLTKETNERVKLNSESLSKTLQKKVLDGTYIPRRMGNDARRRLSEEQSLRNRGGRSKWFVVNGIKVQGTWEYNIALKLNELGIVWSKPKTNSDLFKYELDGKIKSYAPDFYLPKENIYLEVKGYWWGNDREKMQAVISQHPMKQIIIIEAAEYNRIMQGELVWS